MMRRMVRWLRRGGVSVNFLYVLVLSLVLIVPHPAPIGLAVAMIVLGLSRVVGLIHEVARWRGQFGRSGGRGELLRDVALPS